MKLEFLSWFDIITRILFALAVGAIIGLERELTNHPAGIKTHTLVCIGSALAALLTVEMGNDITDLSTGIAETAQRIDISRIAAGVVTGIGFIGAGAIMKSRDGTVVTGITTAATIWVTGCLGLSIGMGYLKMSLVAFVTVFVSNTVLKYIENRFISHGRQRGIEFAIVNKEETLRYLNEYFELNNVKLKNSEYIGKMEDFVSNGKIVYRYRFVIKMPKGGNFSLFINDLSINENIIQIFETSSRDEKKKPDKSYTSEDYD